MILSIIIPLYNKEQYVGHCLNSLLNQNLPDDDFEIIVLDDGSTDNSGNIAKKYADNHMNIHLYSHPNIGISATRNKGLDIAKGEFIYFLDADDYLASNVLLELTEIAKGNKLEILGFHSAQVSDYTQTISTNINANNNSVEVMDGIEFIGKRGYRHEVWWYIINKNFLLDTGILFEEGRMAEDTYFTANIFLKSTRVSQVNLDVHRFVKVRNSIQTSTNYNHTVKFVDDMVFAIEQIHLAKKLVNPEHMFYQQAMMALKRKQQSIIFALFIKVFRCRPPYEINRLNEKLEVLEKLSLYPLSKKVGGFGSQKTRFVYTNFIVPILNNKFFFYLILRLNRLTIKE